MIVASERAIIRWAVLGWIIALFLPNIPTIAQNDRPHLSITLETIDQLVETTRLGRGEIKTVATHDDRIGVGTALGVYFYQDGDLTSPPPYGGGGISLLRFSEDGNRLYAASGAQVLY